MKNLTILITLLFATVIASAQQKKHIVHKARVLQTYALSCKTVDEAATSINTWTGKGWRVKFLLSQSVATSTSVALSWGNDGIDDIKDGMKTRDRDKTGNILIVFEK